MVSVPGAYEIPFALKASLGKPDISGVCILGCLIRGETAHFDCLAGPVFANVVLGDEINRASPKTQAALLEAMEERQVTIDGETHVLAEPFIVVATQNPIEHEGTYPLPEAQLDRFMMRVTMGYPERAKELEMLQTHGGGSNSVELKAVVHAEDVVRMSGIARSVHVADVLQGYLIDIAEATRRHPSVALGMSPRATLSLQRVAKARAASLSRTFVIDDDIGGR